MAGSSPPVISVPVTTAGEKVSSTCLAHLSLLDDVVGVTAGEAGALKQVHDIVLTARTTNTTAMSH